MKHLCKTALSAGLISAASLTSFVAAAAVPPGIYVAEQDGANGNTGSIVNVAGGGDVSNATRFATNLDAPTGMCAGPGGDLYVLDLLEQQVKIATSGGNLGNSSIFATGLAGFSMACTSTQILVAIGSGNVIDITAGGDFAAATPYASGLWAVYSIAFADNGTLWAARAQSAIPPTPIDPGKPALTEVVDITGGGDFAGATAHASFPEKSFLNSVIPMSDGSLYFSHVLSGGVWDITAGGNMNNTPPLATLAPQPRAVVEVEPVGMLASTQSGTVLQVTNGVVTTFATGLKQYGHGIVHVPGCGDGFLDPGEDCDDANQLDNDGCTTICALGNGGEGGEGGAGGTGGEGGTNGVGGMGSGGSDAVGGSGGSDGVGGMGSGGTTNPSGGNAFPEGEPITEDGCACSTAGGDRNDAPWGAGLMLLGLGLILRRRR